LAATRIRLLDAQKQLKTPLKESNGFICKNIANQSEKICQRTLNSLKADLEKVERAIDELIESDRELKQLFALITSVNGVGKVTATQIIITTNEFKDIKDPKKFACYAGVAPFTKESGLFKGKARVSHMANKKVKTLLHMSALAAIVSNPDMKTYYERKVNEEKKNKMLVINAVRNKIILRIFASVNQNRKYEKNYARLVA
jgi:transposase